MKNYSLDKAGARDFILNYIVLNDTIVVNYANGDVSCVPYSFDEEKAILDKMKYQVLHCNKFLNLLNQKYEIFLKLFFDELLLLSLFMIAGFEIALIPLIIGLCSFSIIIGLTGYKLFDYYKIRNDIKKHILFLSNEECLNSLIRNNPSVIRDLDSNLKSKVLSREGNNFSFTINTIDNIKYRELQKVYECAFLDGTKKKGKTLRKRKQEKV